MNWHLLPLTEIAQLLNTTTSGIDNLTASQRLVEYGRNQITDKKKKTVFKMLQHQLTDFMILILISAAVISSILGDVTVTVIILAIIIIDATVFLGGIGFTISIFITLLAFDNADIINNSKIAIIAASIITGTIGFLWFRQILKTPVENDETT